MRKEYTDDKMGAILGLTDDIREDRERFRIRDGLIMFLWNRNDSPVTFEVDGVAMPLLAGQITTVTYLQRTSFPPGHPPLTAILFNRAFYCISDHDSEVSCNGILFFGTQDQPIITPDASSATRFANWYGVFLEEFAEPDGIQGEMLRMLLKRFIILNTRLAKEQLISRTLDDPQIETIRKFNFLVDLHFLSKRKVSDYAELLHRSPKTLSNLFAAYGQRSPQRIILDRLLLEAKRRLMQDDEPVQNIAYDLAFNDPAHFSRFFRKMTGQSPTDFRTESGASAA